MKRANTDTPRHTQTGAQLSWRQRLANASYNSPKSEHRRTYPYGKLRCLVAGNKDSMMYLIRNHRAKLAASS